MTNTQTMVCIIVGWLALLFTGSVIGIHRNVLESLRKEKVELADARLRHTKSLGDQIHQDALRHQELLEREAEFELRIVREKQKLELEGLQARAELPVWAELERLRNQVKVNESEAVNSEWEVKLLQAKRDYDKDPEYRMRKSMLSSYR